MKISGSVTIYVKGWQYSFCEYLVKNKRGERKKKPLKEFCTIKYYFSYIPETGLPIGYPITSAELHTGSSNLEYISDYCYWIRFSFTGLLDLKSQLVKLLIKGSKLFSRYVYKKESQEAYMLLNISHIYSANTSDWISLIFWSPNLSSL